MGTKDLEKMAANRKKNTDRTDFDVATDSVVDEDRPARDTQFVALLPKQVWKDLMKISKMTDVSANEYVNRAIEQFIAENQEEVKRYDVAFKGKGKYS